MQVEESICFAQNAQGFAAIPLPFLSYVQWNFVRKTLQHTEARIVSRFGWGLTKRIENHGLSRFKANMQRVRISFTALRIICWCSSSSLVKAWALFSAYSDSHACSPWHWARRTPTQVCQLLKASLKSVKVTEGRLSGANLKLGFILHRLSSDAFSLSKNILSHTTLRCLYY
jgi:uncharacterized protein YjbI with pentapeptide repeats